MERRTAIAIAGLLGLAIFSWWLLQTLSPQQRTSVADVRHEPDYYFRDAIITRFNDQCLPLFDLYADQVLHFPDDDSVELENIDIEYFRQDAPPWKIRSDKGVIPSGNTLVNLTGNVVMWQVNETTDAPLTLRTERLQILTDRNVAQTEHLVTISEGTSRVHGAGLTADLENELFRLDTQVRAEYEK